MLLQDPRDLVRVRYAAVPCCLARAANQATHRIDVGCLDGLAGQQFVECRGEIIVRRRRANEADSAAIVDAPRVTDNLILVEHEDVGRTRGAYRIGD